MEIMNSATVDPRQSRKAEVKKLKSRQESLLKKAEELHLLHNVQVLMLVYHPDKGEFVQYCSCDPQELIFSKIRAEESHPEKVSIISEKVRVVSEGSQKLQTGGRREMKTEASSVLSPPPPMKKSKASPPDLFSACKPHKSSQSSSSSFPDIASLSTLDSTKALSTSPPLDHDTHPGVPPWFSQAEARPRTASNDNIITEEDESLSSVSDFLSDPF